MKRTAAQMPKNNEAMVSFRCESLVHHVSSVWSLDFHGTFKTAENSRMETAKRADAIDATLADFSVVRWALGICVEMDTG
jgi:hypothetical protein